MLFVVKVILVKLGSIRPTYVIRIFYADGPFYALAAPVNQGQRLPNALPMEALMLHKCNNCAPYCPVYKCQVQSKVSLIEGGMSGKLTMKS
jgi:hypothetical protein